MGLTFTASVWYWRGPAPWYFVSVPDEHAPFLKAALPFITYGWGMIPVDAAIGITRWYTAMFAKDGTYVLPIKAAVRRAEGIGEGDTVSVGLELRPGAAPGGR